MGSEMCIRDSSYITSSLCITAKVTEHARHQKFPHGPILFGHKRHASYSTNILKTLPFPEVWRKVLSLKVLGDLRVTPSKEAKPLAQFLNVLRTFANNFDYVALFSVEVLSDAGNASSICTTAESEGSATSSALRGTGVGALTRLP